MCFEAHNCAFKAHNCAVVRFNAMLFKMRRGKGERGGWKSGLFQLRNYRLSKHSCLYFAKSIQMD